MRISKAVITAAGPDQGNLPLQTLVDRDGQHRTALQLIVAEAVSAGIDDICVVVRPGDCDAFTQAAGEYASRLFFVEQHDPRGYGDALLRSADFVGDEPFLHLVSDHLYLSAIEKSCARQLVDLAKQEQCAVSAVQATRENMLPYFGTVGALRVTGSRDLYKVNKVIEKPTPTIAEQELIVAGLRAGFYLCLFGMHVLTPTVMEILQDSLSGIKNGKRVQLSDALSELARRERYLALQVDGVRHNIGIKYGLLRSQLALALSGGDREQILADLVEMLATGGDANRKDPA